MTNFSDFLSEKYVCSIPKIEVDFTRWNENLSRKDFCEYFTEYLKTLSSVEISRVAEVVLENQ